MQQVPNPEQTGIHSTPGTLPPPDVTPSGISSPSAPATSQHSTPHNSAPPPSGIPFNISLTQTPNYSDFANDLWLSFSVHEQLNVQRGLPVALDTDDAKWQSYGMPDSELSELHSFRQAFPHVLQRLYPSIRPDGLPGQYLHLTQIPYGIEIDPSTGLAYTQQIVIRFDTGYHEMKKSDVQTAALARFEAMGIPLASRFREPVSAIVHPLTKNWLGFLKVDLLNPGIDGIDLLNGSRLFALQLQDFQYVIGKVEKGYDFPSTASNRKLLLKSPSLAQFTSRQLLGELTRLGYIVGANLEFVGVTKRSKELEYAEITVASDRTKKYLLETPIHLSNTRLHVCLPSTDNSNAPEALSTSILVRGLPMNQPQQNVTAALHRLIGPANVLSVSYNQAEGDVNGRHDGIATVRVVNGAVYTTWCFKKGVHCLCKIIDFAPHARSIQGSKPNNVAQQQDQRPTREVIADAITALKNETPITPTLIQFENSIFAVEDRLKSHINTLGSTITNHTTERIDHVITHQQSQHTRLTHQLQLLTSASRDYSLHMSGIFSALNSGPPEGPPIQPPPLENTTYHE